MERAMIKRHRLQRLLDRGVLAEEELDRVLRESDNSDDFWPEEVLIKNGVPRHEVLLSLAGYYECPFVEYDEGIVLSRPLMKRIDMEELKSLLWVPLSASEENAEVVAYLPGDATVIEQIKRRLHVRNITFRVALPHDIIRIIEHNQDVNPAFPACGGEDPSGPGAYLPRRQAFPDGMPEDRPCQGKDRSGLHTHRCLIHHYLAAAPEDSRTGVPVCPRTSSFCIRVGDGSRRSALVYAGQKGRKEESLLHSDGP